MSIFFDRHSEVRYFRNIVRRYENVFIEYVAVVDEIGVQIFDAVDQSMTDFFNLNFIGEVNRVVVERICHQLVEDLAIWIHQLE